MIVVIGHTYVLINNMVYAIGHMCYYIYLYSICVITHIYIRYVLLNISTN